MERRPTIIDIADKAGVSFKSVSRVINNEPSVSPRMRRQVQEAMDELGFELNGNARNLRSQTVEQTFLIAQLYGDAGGFYSNELQVGLMERCRYFGYHLLVEEIDYRGPTLERQARELVSRFRPDGVVLAAPLTDNEAILNILARAGVPYVRITPLHESPLSPSVRMDERTATYQMTQHLLTLGHTRIGFIRGPENHAATHLRYAGFSQALHDAKLRVDPNLVKDGEFRYLTALGCAQQLLGRPDRPTAIFACSDEMAAASMKVAHDMNLRLPDQLSVVGFDDMTAAQMLWPALTTIRQPVKKMGAAAIDLLFTRLSSLGSREWPNPAPHVVLDHDIVLRNSTAPAWPGSALSRQQTSNEA